ncbi:MAG: MATE family efflux transporter [Rhodobacteraceae bacterium]|nr:MATE family efflux transporter [Paracoccaceae bacterium]
MNRSRDFTSGSIPGHFRSMALPIAIGMVFTTLYNVVDSFYAGLISTDALAGLAISFHVFFLLVSAGFGVNAAMGALVGRALGANRPRRAKRIACQGLSFAVIASLLLTIIGFVISPIMVWAVSEPGNFRDLANAYLSLLLIATPSFLITFSANGILTAQGDAISMQRAQIAAFFANVILNPVMIFGIPGLFGGIGFNGIALSTLTVQTAVMLFILFRVLRSEVMMHASPSVYRPRLRNFREIVSQALPTSSAMVVMLIGAFIVQLFLREFGPEAIAAYGVALRIEQLLLLPGFGLTIALLPITAQNLGAGDYERVRQSFKFCCKAGLALMFAAALILWFAARPAMQLFTDNPDVVRIGVNYLNVDGFMLPMYILLFAINSLLQALKRPIYSLWIGLYRQGIGIAVFCALFVYVFGMGSWGVWFGIAASVASGLVLALVIAKRLASREIGGLFRHEN